MNQTTFLREFILPDGRKIAYSAATVFLVQVGKGKKGAYKTKYLITGNLSQAAIMYDGINIGYPYKKRLIMPSAKRLVISKSIGI